MNLKAIIALAKKYWYLVPMLGLGFALMTTRESAAKKEAVFETQRKAWDAERKSALAQKKVDETRWNQAHELAVKAFDQRAIDKDPIIVRATNTVREYEKTDASHVQCLDAEWVRRLKESRAALFPQDTGTTSQSADPVQAQ